MSLANSPNDEEIRVIPLMAAAHRAPATCAAFLSFQRALAFGS